MTKLLICLLTKSLADLAGRIGQDCWVRSRLSYRARGGTLEAADQGPGTCVDQATGGGTGTGVDKAADPRRGTGVGRATDWEPESDVDWAAKREPVSDVGRAADGGTGTRLGWATGGGTGSRVDRATNPGTGTEVASSKKMLESSGLGIRKFCNHALMTPACLSFWGLQVYVPWKGSFSNNFGCT